MSRVTRMCCSGSQIRRNSHDPTSCKPRLTITHADGSIETRDLPDVAIVPVIDMPAEITDATEIEDEGA